MLQLNSLNNDILRNVLKYALYTLFSGFDTWKESFLWLTVCRRWRELAVPIVYKTAYIVNCDSELEMEIGPAESACNCEDQDMATNFNLAKVNNCSNYMRHANIKVFFASDPFTGLEKVLTMISSLSSSWKRINSLSLSLNHDIISPNLDTDDCDKSQAYILQMAHKVHHLMPSLSKIEFKGTRSNSAVRDFYGNLTSLYSNQLKQLQGRHPIHLEKGIQFMQITRLDIRVSSKTEYSISQACAASLVNLSLRGVAPDYEWVQFTELNGTKSITFPNLQILKIHYLQHSSASFPYRQLTKHLGRKKIHLPKLQKLGIWNDNNMCILLASAVFPSSMKCIEFVGSSDLLSLVSQTVLPKADKLILTAVSTSNSSLAATVPSINHILSKSSACTDVHLTILEDTIPIDVQIIEWSLVTYLQLATHIDMAVSLTLLEKLHNLNQIVFYNFDMVNVPSEAFEIADDAPQNTRLSPLNTKLVKLMLDYDRPEYTDELVMAVIKYLALRLTSLKVFGAWIAFDAALASFIDNYKATYPHLVDLVFKLGMVE